MLNYRTRCSIRCQRLKQYRTVLNPLALMATRRTGGRNYHTSEYRTIFAHAVDLRLAIRDHLRRLEAKLLSRSIIFIDELPPPVPDYWSLRAQSTTKLARAALLVWKIQSKVERDVETFHTFIGVLEEDKERYCSILSKLQQTYSKFLKGTSVYSIGILGSH